MRVLTIILTTVLSLGAAAQETITRAQLDALLDSTVNDWRFKAGEVDGAQAPDFDDSAWETVDVGHEWWPHDSVCWFRKQIVIPERVNGIPVDGATLRLRVGMDNQAEAYVNGLPVQAFEWDDGDFVIAENARPGDTVCVALKGINGPGFGRFYEAYLVSSAISEAVEGLRSFLDLYDRLESYLPFAPRTEFGHWYSIAHACLQPLDLDAYYVDELEEFQESLDNARDVLFSDQRTIEPHMAKTAATLDGLKERIAKGREMGRAMDYPSLNARVAESFLAYVREDLADGAPARTLRALQTAHSLYSMVDEGVVLADVILDYPPADLHAPKYKTGPIETRDGAFWQEGRPVFFTGVGHFSQVRKDVPILGEYGLNIIQIEIGPKSVVTGPDTVNDTAIRQDILATLDNCAAHNIAMNLLISPHYFPEWAFEKWPELGECGFGFMKNCIEAPEARDIYERFLRTLMPLIAKHPALHSITLSNEPQYDGRCRHSLLLYQDWLKARYPAVEDMNAVYGSQYASFDEVPFPAGIGQYAQYYDFCVFNQARFLRFHEFLRDLIHEFNPALPVHAKVMSHAFGDQGKFEVGIDYEAFSKIDRISGNDCTQTFIGLEDGPYLQRWQDMALNYTLQHSVAPRNPIFNSEDHIIADGDTRFIPAKHIRTAYWTQALHGQGAATTWVWERAQDGDFAENILTRANCVLALGRVALDLNRCAAEMHALQNASTDAAILYVAAAMLPSNAFTEEAAAAYEGLYFTDTTPAFVTADMAAAGKLKDYRFLIVPNVSHAPDAVARAVQEFIASGGTVLAGGECFTHDEYGRARQQGLVQAGSGRLVAYPRRLSACAYGELADALMDNAGCRRPVRLRSKFDERLWGINLRTVEQDGKQLVSLVNYGRAAFDVNLKTERRIARVFDVLGGYETVLPRAVKPLDPVLLSIEYQTD